MLSFLLVRLYTNKLPTNEYGDVSIVMAWMVFLNVALSYGFETGFFRFYNSEQNKENVVSTSTISIFWSSLAFLGLALSFRNSIAHAVNVDSSYITYAIWILVLDALVVIPFSKLRAQQRPMRYAVIKIGNVIINMGLNLICLLWLPVFAQNNPDSFLSSLYVENFEVGYIFMSNLIASLLTFVVLSPDYFKVNWHIDPILWKRMMKYGLPIFFAGIAFAVNEHFDKILLEKILPANVGKTQAGIYSACYKLALFMTLYATAFRLGIEPFFFSHAGNDNAKETYAVITKYFVIFGSLILLSVVVFADVLKLMLLDNPDYWEAMKVVPLIIVANFFLGIYTNLSVWYKLIDKTHIGAYISFVGAAVTLGLNILLIPMFQKKTGDGYMGSAIATIAAYGSMMVISYLMGQKRYEIPYDMKRILGYLGVSITFSFVAFYVFRENYFVNIPLLLVFSGLVYYGEKETLEGIIKRRRRTKKMEI
ncbi:oligosaccharide flippase family protein [Flavobacterium sp. D33]|nr:oligosaccharide flippase family protein [Flavobacterium selenitireducens]